MCVCVCVCVGVCASDTALGVLSVTSAERLPWLLEHDLSSGSAFTLAVEGQSVGT